MKPFKKLTDILLGKEVYFYDPRVWQDPDSEVYRIQIFKCRPGKRNQRTPVKTLEDFNLYLLLFRVKVWVDAAKQYR